MTLDLDRRGARRKHGRDGEAIELEEGYSDEHQEFVQEAAAAHGFDMWVEATNTARDTGTVLYP